MAPQEYKSYIQKVDSHTSGEGVLHRYRTSNSGKRVEVVKIMVDISVVQIIQKL